MEMCSKCFRDATEGVGMVQAEQPAAVPSPLAEVAQLESAILVPKADTNSEATPSREASAGLEVASPKPETRASADAEDAKKGKNRNRCFECRKKVGLVGGFECKCGYVFCSSHRMPDEHNCAYDFKAEGKQRLAEENQEVRAARIEKI